ncbi:MAG: DUF305 domain-containing protein [Sporichthyaceae bacterium]
MMRSTLRTRTAALGGGLLVLTLVLAACGDDSTAGPGSAGTSPTSSSSGPATTPSPTPASGPHNDADVAFATGMIPHHGQAIFMAELAETRAQDPAVKELAAAIKAAQAPEIAQMSGWLVGWGAEVPDADSMATGMDHDMGSMGGDDSTGLGGMMSADDMTTLENAAGTGFDRMWLTGMVAHHEGAVDMAKAELTKGASPDATSLARAIISAQQAEIRTMTELLAG